MNIDLGTFAFGSIISSGGGTPSWGTALGQSQPDYRITYPGAEVIVMGMVYNSVPLKGVRLPLGKGGKIYTASDTQECQLAALFRKVYVNNIRVDYPFTMVLVKENSDSHYGRRSIKYSDKNEYLYGGESFNNGEFIKKARFALSINDDACWFVYALEVKNQDELHMYAVVVDDSSNCTYENSSERKREWLELIPETSDFKDIVAHEKDEELQDSFQTIYYGAPGTGKSKKIKDITEQAEKEGRVFRTTFHPDSDYSTFVGCYKPGMKSSDRIYSAEELAVKLKEVKNSGVTYPCHKFAAQYWRSLKDLSADTIKQILIACGFTESMNVEISKGVAIGQEYLNKDEDGKIVYTFTPQAFTNAYVKAWNTTEDVYLIIEEINRGNCAQIFGDLFQLLDRKDGFSEYPVDADADLANYISKKLENSSRTDFPDGVKEGKKLVLPKNLYILATMNTSDQSLFPIDSAFKRRWDWKYIPIEDAGKNWRINVNNNEYDWYQFLEAVNKEVFTLTHSEDKQLGYFFAKAQNNVIDAETLVNKVFFYLWTDVFKDYEYESQKTFRKPNSTEAISFKDFFVGGKIDETMAEQVLINLELNKPVENAE